MIRAWVIRALIGKELLEVVRDRRALFLMTVFPFLLYPALMVVSTQLMTQQLQRIEAEPARVGVSGPEVPDGLRHHLDPSANLELVALDDTPARAAVAAGAVRAAVLVPEGFEHILAGGGQTTLEVVYDATSEKSQMVREQLREAITDWSRTIVERRLAGAGLEPEFARPLELESINVAPPDRLGGHVLGRIVPLLLVTMVLLGAFYPAVEVTAGEKERGTLQTLLTAPMTPMEIVTGKFVAVCSVACLSATANVASLALMFGLIAFAPIPGAEQLDLALSIAQLGLVGIIALLIGLMVSAVMMTIAVLARTLKEAQAYLSPVMILGIMPGMVAMLPGLELDGLLQVTPIVNQTLLLREVLEGTIIWQHVFVVVVSSLIYTAGTLTVASRIFEHEAILLGEAGISGLVRGGPARRGVTPGDAMALMAVVFILLFYAGQAVQSWRLLPGLAITQWGLILVPCLVLLRLRRARPGPALGLRPPPWTAMGSAALIGGAAWYPILIVTTWLHEREPEVDDPTREVLRELLEQLVSPEVPVAWVLAVVALSPAICEEVLFRGVLLRSLAGRFGTRFVVLATAVLFGVFHMSIERFVPTALLGLVLALLALRSGSLWPGVLLHFLHNGITVLIARLGWRIPGVSIEGTEGRPELLHVAVAALALAAGVALLVATRPPGTGAVLRENR